MTYKEKKQAISKTREILLADLIRKHYKGNQTQFAKSIGKKQPQINRYFSKSEKKRPISDSFSHEVEKFFNLPIGWLSNPTNITSDYAKMLEAQNRFENDIDTTTNDSDHIPLLPIKLAVEYALSNNNPQINITDKIITSSFHSKKAFAIIMPDQSMQTHTENISFNKDDILLIEPSIAPQSGDFVFVILDTSTHNIATVAQLIISLNSRYLRQFNPFVELEIPAHAQIIGIVTEKKTLLLNEFNLLQRLNTK